jgi:DNA (cytosine-5)-methyltransferase 1
MAAPLRTGPWNLSELKDVPKNGYKVFSCFHCGGGSSFGYKLAGYDVLGGVEIDKEMMEIYKRNHNPKHSYLMGVQDFNKIPDNELPEELFNIDILDGSPPCSVFSTSGAREKKWGELKHFREGQAKQILDDLFFHFIDIANKLKPRIVIAENVKGLILGNAKGYVKEIFQAFDKAGYDCQLFLLNASRMGVPQARERTFFLARRKDLNLDKIKLEFNENVIRLKDAFINIENEGKGLTAHENSLWSKCKNGEDFGSVHAKGQMWSHKKLSPEKPANTMTGMATFLHWDAPRHINNHEIKRIQTFPEDYDFLKQKTQYVCGMSVPPFMTQRVAQQIEIQWLNKLKETSNGQN